MTLVDNHMNPLNLRQQLSVLDDIFVRREEDLEISVLDFDLSSASLGGRTFVRDHSNGRGPFLELHDPVWHCRQRDDDEERSILLFRFDEESDESDRLNSFS